MPFSPTALRAPISTDYHGEWRPIRRRPSARAGRHVDHGAGLQPAGSAGYRVFQKDGFYFRTSPARQRSRWLRRGPAWLRILRRRGLDPGPVCGGVDPDASPASRSGVFQQPTLRCQDPAG